MSEFEYVMIVMSVLLAAAFTRLLDATYSNIVRGGDWIVSVWLVDRLISALMIFWAYRAARESMGDHVTVGLFLVMLVPPVFLFLQALALSATVLNVQNKLGENFLVRKHYFAVFAGITAMGNALNAYVFDAPTPIGAHLTILAIFTGVYFSNRRSVHIGLVTAHLGVLGVAVIPPLVTLL